MGFLDFLKGKGDGGTTLPMPKRTYTGAHGPRVVTVWSSKGGVGKTTIAVNLAAYIQASGRSVVIVDVDEFGDAGYMAARQERYEERYGGSVPGPEWLWSGINDVRTRGDLLAYLFHNAETDCYVLPAQQEAAPGKRLTARAYDRITTLLLQYFDVVVFDCGPAYQEETIRFALLRCDCLVSPFTQNIMMLQAFGLMIREFAKPTSGIGKDKMVLVLNYYRAVPGIMTDRQARETFGPLCHAVEIIPHAGVAGAETAQSGDLLVHRAPPAVRNAYRDILQSVLDVLYSDQGKAQR